MKTISVVLACYNEQDSLPLYFKAVDEIIKEMKDYRLEFVLVNDGSKDDTLKVMKELHDQREDVMVVSLSRNFGQNPAFSAGLSVAKGDYVILMDSDLQDPVTMIPKIAEKFSEGYEVVNPHRYNRMKDSAFKRKTAGLFYKIINKLEGKKVIPENVNCFRGFSRKVVDAINALTEKDRYILAEVPLIGYKTCEIDFAREERQVGQSKYNLKKMVQYSLDNMSNETKEPLYWPIKVGGFSLLFWVLVSIVMIVLYFVSYYTNLPGNLHYMVFMIVSLIFSFLSFNLCFIGLLGVYLHNVVINTRNRPNYIIDEVLEPKRKD